MSLMLNNKNGIKSIDIMNKQITKEEIKNIKISNIILNDSDKLQNIDDNIHQDFKKYFIGDNPTSIGNATISKINCDKILRIEEEKEEKSYSDIKLTPFDEKKNPLKNEKKSPYIQKSPEKFIISQQSQQEIQDFMSLEEGVENYFGRNVDWKIEILNKILNKHKIKIRKSPDIDTLEQQLIDFIHDSNISKQQDYCMMTLTALLVFIEKINYKFSFLQFDLKCWADETLQQLKTQKNLVRKCFMDVIQKIKIYVFSDKNKQYQNQAQSQQWHSFPPYVELVMIIIGTLFTHCMFNGYVSRVKNYNEKIQEQKDILRQNYSNAIQTTAYK